MGLEDPTESRARERAHQMQTACPRGPGQMGQAPTFSRGEPGGVTEGSEHTPNCTPITHPDLHPE